MFSRAVDNAKRIRDTVIPELRKYMADTKGDVRQAEFIRSELKKAEKQLKAAMAEIKKWNGSE
jgi:hypothetical protein